MCLKKGYSVTSLANYFTASFTVYSWKLSRSKTLSAAANTAINNKISEVDVLHQQYYENIDQSEDACFFLPDLAPGEPVVFDGQCDRNIPIVQNFNAARVGDSKSFIMISKIFMLALYRCFV